MVFSGIIELIAFILLTLFGERESPSFHIVFFVNFLFFCGVHFILLSYLTPNKNFIKSYSNWRQMFQLNSDFLNSKKFSQKNILNKSNTSLSITSTRSNSIMPTLTKQSILSYEEKNFKTIDFKSQRKLRCILTVILFCFAILITISFNINFFYCIKHCKF